MAERKTSVTADAQLQPHKGYYYGYTVTVVTANAAISVYDSLTEAGTVVDVIPAATAAGVTKTFATPIPMSTGIYVGYAATATGTVVFLHD